MQNKTKLFWQRLASNIKLPNDSVEGDSRTVPNLVTVVCYLLGYEPVRRAMYYLTVGKGGVFDFVASHCSIVYDLFFILICLLVCRKQGLRDSWENLVGKSQFDAKNTKHLVELTIFAAAVCSAQAVYQIIFSTHQIHSILSWPAFHSLVRAPIIEETIHRGIIMHAFEKWYTGTIWMPVVFSTLIFVSVHRFEIYPPAEVVTFGLISGICYARFRSVGCCAVLHFIGCLYCYKLF